MRQPCIVEADKLKRQEQVNAKADDALGFEPHITRPPGPQTPESFVDKEEMRRLLQDVGGDREDVHHHLWGRRINFDYINTNDDVYKLIDEIQDVYTSELNARRGKNRAFDETKDLAETLGLSSPDKIKENLQRLFSTTEVLDAQVHGARTYVNALFAHLQDLAVKIDAGDAGEEGIKDFMRQFALAGESVALLRGASGNIGRALKAHQIKITPTSTIMQDGMEVPQNLAQILDDKTLTYTRKVAKLLATASGPQAIRKIVKPTTYEKGRDIVLEYFINSILSGPKTHMVNMLSSAANTVYNPLERIIGGLVTLDKGEIMEGCMIARNVMGGLCDLVTITAKGGRLHLDVSPTSPYKAAVDSFISNQPYHLGSSPFDEVRPHSLSAERLGIDPVGLENNVTTVLGNLRDENYAEALRGMMVHSLNWMGNVVNLPGRFLTTEDAFFKALNAQAYQRAQHQRLGLRPEGLSPSEMAAKSIEIEREAMAYADTVTFTSPLPKRGISRSISDLTNHHPELKLIVPFIRTPANILKFWHHRTPGLNLLSKEFRGRLFSEDKRIQSQALGQLSTGWILTALAIDFARQGKVVGDIPKEQKDAATAKGILSYSFRMGEGEDQRYVQFSRLDPFGMFFGVAADLHSLISTVERGAANYGGVEKFVDAITGTVVALAQNLNGRSYLVGLSNFLNALGDPDHKGQRFLNNMIKGFVPNFLQQLRREEDPLQRNTNIHIFREAENLINYFKDKTPGLSKDLPPALDLFGDEIYNARYPGGLLGPIAVSEDKQNPVADELWRLKMKVHPASPEIQGVHLTPQQHHDYILASSRPSSRPSLKETLARLIASFGYQKLPEGSEDVEGMKQNQIRKIIAAYRSVGQALFLKAHPEVQAEIDQRKRLKFLP